jgi:hypothetical protein
VGREPVTIHNPKGNNRDIIVEAMGQSGKIVRLAFLKPGDSCRLEKDDVIIRSIKRPLTLDFVYKDGVFCQKEEA